MANVMDEMCLDMADANLTCQQAAMEKGKHRKKLLEKLKKKLSLVYTSVDQEIKRLEKEND